MSETGKQGDNVRAVDRALEILLAFTAADTELTATQLLKRVNLSRPTLYRLLYTMEQRGFIVADGDPQKFRLGPAIARLAHVWSSSQDVGAAALPMLQRLQAESGETSALFVLAGADRLCLVEVPSPQPLSFRRGVGFRESIAKGASGHALLAYLGDDDEQRRGYAARHGFQIDTPARAFEEIRKRGYAISHHELIQGAVAIAAPFFDHTGKVVGSLSLYGPSVRFDDDKIARYADLVIEACADLSRALGAPAR